MEQENIFKTYDLNGQFGPNASSWFASASANNIPQNSTPPAQGRWGLQTPDIKTFLCPAAYDPSTINGLVQTTAVGYADIDFRGSLYGGSATTASYNVYIYGAAGSPYVVSNTGQTNYLFNRGYVTNGAAASPPAFGPAQGPFRYNKKAAASPGPYQTATGTTPDGRGLSIVSVTDGTSNTIFFMESNGGFLNNSGIGVNGWVGMNWGHAPFYADFGTCPDRTNATPAGNCDFSAQGKGFGLAIPSSNHANNRIMTLFGDGSVRGLAANVNYTAFTYMCGASDGQIVTFDN